MVLAGGGVGVVGAVAVDDSPAVGSKDIGGSAAGAAGDAVEVLLEGQVLGGIGHTGSAEGDRGGTGNRTVTASGVHSHCVGGVGSEGAEGVAIAAGRSAVHKGGVVVEDDNVAVDIVGIADVEGDAGGCQVAYRHSGTAAKRGCVHIDVVDPPPVVDGVQLSDGYARTRGGTGKEGLDKEEARGGTGSGEGGRGHEGAVGGHIAHHEGAGGTTVLRHSP